MKFQNILFTIFVVLLACFLGGCDEAKAGSSLVSPSSAITTGSSTITVTSQPLTTAKVGTLYTYQIQAKTTSSNPLTFQLIQGPQGMTLNATTGKISWTPSASQVGTRAIKVEILDGSGVANHSWQITVGGTTTGGTGNTSNTSNTGNTGNTGGPTTGSGGSGGGGLGQILSKTLTVTTSSETISGKYYIYVPTTYQSSTPIPIVYSQHGAGGNGYQMVALWKNTAQTNKFIVVGQDSQGAGWDFSKDISVFEKVKKTVEGLYNIDLKQVYLHGFSAGAHWGLVYGLYRSDKFAAMSLSAGGYMAFAIQTGVWPGNVPRKIPVDIHVGTQDPNLTMATNTKNTLSTAGHKVYFTTFNGGHTIYPSHTVEAWNNMKKHRLP